MQFMIGLPKSYETSIVLGIATSTLDEAGEVTGRWDQRNVTVEAARNAASGLSGSISQVPPMVSAVKVGGRRLHELARRGIEVERPSRMVTVTRFDVEVASGEDAGEIDPPAGPVLRARIDCSSGTYVRVLAAELGAALGGGAHVRRLRRVAVGPWGSEVAVDLDVLAPDRVLRPFDALPWMPAVLVDEDLDAAVRHGRVLEPARLGVGGGGPWRVASSAGELLAVYERHPGGLVKPAVVVAPATGAPPGGGAPGDEAPGDDAPGDRRVGR
jgi:tRNA pseudouridine55 synthase